MTDANLTPKKARQELYKTIRKDVSFDRKAREALALGEQYLGADNGHLTRIDQETDHWEALVSTDSPDGRFPPGLELDLETTYCRRTIAENSPITLHNAPKQGWDDDPAFETHGLHCYHGTVLILDEEPYGTVCFVAEDPRREQFRDGETMFVELITRLLERELEREQHEAELTKQANLTAVLNRVLRHNLRNKMTVIRGYTQQMANNLEDDTYADPALQSIDKLIALSQKARELDRVVSTKFEREPSEIVALVERIVETMTTEYKSASVSVEFDEELAVAVLPSFEMAIEELIENALKHSGETPTVTVTVEPVPNAVEIRIADDGPGLADHEADVLKTGTETPLTHGSGLGLWVAHWIVTSHGGSIDATITEEGTTMTITVPRKPATNVQQQLSKLTRARDQYQAAFEEAADAMVIINDDGMIVDANQEAANIYGVDSQDLLGRSLPMFLPAECDFEAAWQEFQNDGVKHDSVTIVAVDYEGRPMEYSATIDIVPGQHLVIGREIPEVSK